LYFCSFSNAMQKAQKFVKYWWGYKKLI
jgi:hypothetical protein